MQIYQDYYLCILEHKQSALTGLNYHIVSDLYKQVAPMELRKEFEMGSEEGNMIYVDSLSYPGLSTTKSCSARGKTGKSANRALFL
jgi:hypothetical protein